MIKHICAITGIVGLLLTGSACSGASSSQGNDDFAAPTVVMHGAKVAFYDQTTPAGFARTGFVTEVVIGTVTKVETVVYPDSDVFTAVTIAVDRASKDEPRVVVTREPGGVTTLGEVRSDFENHIPDEVINDHVNDPIEYVDMDDPLHSKVGQHVVAFLGGNPSNVGGYFTAASMVQSADGSYDWLQADAPNPKWRETLPEQNVDRIAAAE